MSDCIVGKRESNIVTMTAHNFASVEWPQRVLKEREKQPSLTGFSSVGILNCYEFNARQEPRTLGFACSLSL